VKQYEEEGIDRTEDGLGKIAKRQRTEVARKSRHYEILRADKLRYPKEGDSYRSKGVSTRGPPVRKEERGGGAAGQRPPGAGGSDRGQRDPGEGASRFSGGP